MSSREPMWYCHECHAEMRPLMVPDPHCASCNGTFVEKLENPTDDPREFAAAGPDDEMEDDFLFTLQNLVQSGAVRSTSPPGAFPSGPRSPGSGGGITIHVNRSGGNNGSQMFVSGGPARRGSGSDRTGEIPTLSEFMAQHGSSRTRGQGQGRDARDTIEGPLMLQYLLAMLQHPGGRGGDPLAGLFGGAPPSAAESGRWGDYVFNQEALDQIISQIMENSQSHPVPATEEIANKLPRDVLEEGSPLLDKDCAICKDQFSLKTEDPDEQVVVTLPCSHPFHEPCIMPWLKSSGTCPVCRYQLVPQPEHHSPNPGSSSGSSGGNGNNNRERSPSGSAGGNNGGLFGGLFNILNGAAGPSGSGASTNTRNNPRSTNSRSNSTNDANNGSNNRPRSPPSRRGSGGRGDIPGAWYDVD